MRCTPIIDYFPSTIRSTRYVVCWTHPPAEVPKNVESPSTRIKTMSNILPDRVNDDRGDALHVSGKVGVYGLNGDLLGEL